MLKIKTNQILTIPKRISQKTINLDWTGDIHPPPTPECPIFENAETVIFTGCNKHFVYYWLRPDLFPKLTTVYTDMLCDNEIFRFKNLLVYCSNKYICDQFQRRIALYKKSNASVFLINDEYLKMVSRSSSDPNRE